VLSSTHLFKSRPHKKAATVKIVSHDYNIRNLGNYGKALNNLAGLHTPGGATRKYHLNLGSCNKPWKIIHSFLNPEIVGR